MKISDAIHPDDEMFVQSLDHYMSCGRQMGAFAARAAEIAGVDPASAVVLDLPSGYGRTTRHLAAYFEPQNIVAADILPEAARFCASQFGIHDVQIKEPVYEFRNLEDGRFNVGVMGSLVTHLSEANASATLENFFRKMAKGGVAVVSIHGHKSREVLGAGDEYQVGEEGRRQLIAAYDVGKFGFAPYRPGHDLEKQTVEFIGDSYGISLVPESWMRAFSQKQGLTVVEIIPGGWDGHHDIYFIAKA